MATLASKIGCCVFRLFVVFVYMFVGAGIFVIVESQDEDSKRHRAERYFSYFNLAFMSVTTIGDGFVAPKTDIGRGIYMAFAAIGIPLMLWFLSLAGELQTMLYKAMLCEHRFLRWNRAAQRGRCSRFDYGPFFISLFMFISFWMTGAALTFKYMDFTFLDAAYFWFQTWSTTGFGDISLSNKGVWRYYPWILWKFLGLVLLAAVFHSFLGWMHNMGDRCELFCCVCYGGHGGDMGRGGREPVALYTTKDNNQNDGKILSSQDADEEVSLVRDRSPTHHMSRDQNSIAGNTLDISEAAI